MKKTVLIILLVIVSFSIKAQDLISGGANSWILHTPDDRTSLLVAPKTSSVWDWAKATQFYNNGNVSFIGNIGIGTNTPSSKHQVVVNNAGLNFVSTYINRYGTDTGGNAVGIGFLNEGAAGADWFKSGIVHERLGGYGIGTLHFLVNNSISPTATTLADAKISITSNGNVGIGTKTPRAKLEVNGDVLLKDDLKFKYAGKKIEYYSDATHRAHIQLYNITNGNIEIENVWSGGNADIVLKPDNNVIVSNGNLGIGTTTTGSHKLAVEGSIGAREIKVEAFSNWSDFVFEKEYKLPTLKEVENHIKEKGHLKDIPSAIEVKKDGFYLGKMDAKLLQKIEELTLYTIQQEKEITALKNQKIEVEKIKKENKDLKNRLEKLEKLVNKLL